MKSFILFFLGLLIFEPAFAGGFSAKVAKALIDYRCRARTSSDWGDAANALSVCTPRKGRGAIDCTYYCAENYHAFFLSNFMNLTFEPKDYLAAEKTVQNFSKPVTERFVLKNKRTNYHYQLVSQGDEKYLMYYYQTNKTEEASSIDAGCRTLVKIEDGKCVAQKYNDQILGLFKGVRCANTEMRHINGKLQEVSVGPNSKVKDIKFCDDVATAMTKCLSDYKSCEAKILARNERIDASVAMDATTKINQSQSQH